jgi:hypothetical protein
MYKEIKFKDLPEGVGFWNFKDEAGNPETERKMVKGKAVWADGTSGKVIVRRNKEATIYIKESNMADLKAELAQAEAGRQAIRDDITSLSGNISKADKEIARLKQQIAEGGVVYSIGDRFYVWASKEKHMLCYSGDGKVSLVSLRDGLRVGGLSVKFKDGKCITQSEVSEIFRSRDVTRYWDSQKKEKC